MEVFSSKVPERAYAEIGIIEGEGTMGAESLEDVLPEMTKEACLAGGDALILTSSERTVSFSGGEIRQRRARPQRPGSLLVPQSGPDAGE